MAEKIIQNPSITSGDFSFSGDAITAIGGHPVAGVGGGGTQSDYVYVPSFNDQTGDITFTLGVTGSEGKGPWHISGAQGPQGIQGPTGPEGASGKSFTYDDFTPEQLAALKGDRGDPGADACPITATSTTAVGGTHVTISYTSGGDPLAQFDVLSGAKGADGQKGTDGKDGISPTFTTSVTSDAQHPQGGTHVVISGAAGESAFNVWNGVDGEGATVNLLDGTGIHIEHEAGTANYTISVSADYLTTVSADSTLSGDGTSAHPLGIDMSSAYSIDGAHGITAIPNIADKKVIVQMTDDVWAYYQHLAASANIWDSASAIGNKSKTVINNSVNTITTENSGTSATLSAVEYKVNTSFQNAAPKQLFVVYDDNDIYTKLSEVNGKGSLFFVCSAI